MPLSPRLFLAATALTTAGGGIARVGRLVARVLAAEGHALPISGVVLQGESVPAEFPFMRATHGRRSEFAWRLGCAAWGHTHFLYNFVGLARGHCPLAFVRRPFALFINGIEIWEQARSDRVYWARRADLLLSNSAYTRDRAERTHGGLSHAKVCWLATEEDEPPVRQVGHHPPTVLILARLAADEQYKGHDELIEAWPQVCRAVPDARLLIVGSGADLDRLRTRANQCSGAIEFRGFVPDEKMQQVWDEADVFAMPSRGEGFGLVYVEAMRQGLPVIASIHDAGSEINLHGETGFNIDLDRPGELAARLIEVLGDAGLRRRMGEAGRERWAEHFRFRAFRQRFLGLLLPWLEKKG